MPKSLSVRCAFNGVPPEIKRLGEEVVSDRLLAYYGDIEHVEAAINAAREFRDAAGMKSWSAQNSVAAMEACQVMGIPRWQMDKRGFVVQIVDNKEGPC